MARNYTSTWLYLLILAGFTVIVKTSQQDCSCERNNIHPRLDRIGSRLWRSPFPFHANILLMEPYGTSLFDPSFTRLYLPYFPRLPHSAMWEDNELDIWSRKYNNRLDVMENELYEKPQYKKVENQDTNYCKNKVNIAARNAHSEKREMVERSNILSVGVRDYDQSELSVSLDGDQIVVKGKHVCKSEDSCSYREFSRINKLPDGIDEDSIRARIDDDGRLVISGDTSIKTPPALRAARQRHVEIQCDGTTRPRQSDYRDKQYSEKDDGITIEVED